jgi:hypothetical protein
MLLLLKLSVTPVLVAVISVAARAWGPTVGALLMGLPWLTGPILFFMAMEKGTEFAGAACIGIQLGVVCICPYLVAYGAATAAAPWPVCLAAATAAFGGAAWATRDLSIGLLEAASLAAAGLVLTYLVLPRSRGEALPAPLPWWDIPARMLATFMLVGGIALWSEVLGPQLSGVASTFPAIVTVVGTFTHHQWGRDAVRGVLRGLALSMLAFVAFFLVVGMTLPTFGLVPAYVLGTVAALPVSALVLAFSRRRPSGRRTGA